MVPASLQVFFPLPQSTSNDPLFRSTLLELALLSLIVGVMAASIYSMRRSNGFVPPDDETTLLDDE